MWLSLYGTPQDLQVVFQALTLISVCSCSANSNFRAFQLYTNTKVEIESLGFGLGLSRKVYIKELVNYNYAEFKFDQAKTQVLKLVLTLKHRVKASFEMKNYLRTFFKWGIILLIYGIYIRGWYYRRYCN
jgi:hypothetical protein